MAKKDDHTDIGSPQTIWPEKDRKNLVDEIDRDQRDEAVNELFDEARDLYWQAGGQFDPQTEEDALKAVMRLCWERWAEPNQ